MGSPLRIGGEPAVRLTATDAPAEGPAFLEATILPGRGMMLLQARLRLASGQVVDALASPDAAAAARALGGGPDDFAGNASFSFGAAILAPYANRIRGRAVAGAREIETEVAGRTVRLPRNWGGKAAGAEQYAMHGLILATAVPWRQAAPDRVSGRLEAGDFDGRWLGRARLDVEWRLDGGALRLHVTASEHRRRRPCRWAWAGILISPCPAATAARRGCGFRPRRGPWSTTTTRCCPPASSRPWRAAPTISPIHRAERWAAPISTTASPT